MQNKLIKYGLAGLAAILVSDLAADFGFEALDVMGFPVRRALAAGGAFYLVSEVLLKTAA